jgi:hypothetical protein
MKSLRSFQGLTKIKPRPERRLDALANWSMPMKTSDPWAVRAGDFPHDASAID